MSYRGLGQTKPGAVDNTARDVGTAVNVGGSLIGGLIGAATGRPATTTETPTTPEPYVPDVEAPGGGYFWPVAIGVGVLVVGGVAWMGMQAKLPKVASNRRRKRKSVRRNTTAEEYAEIRNANKKKNSEGLTWTEWAYAAGVREPPSRYVAATGHHETPGNASLFRAERRAWLRGEDPTEWRGASSPIPNRLTPRQRAALPKSAFVFPARRAWPLDTPERAYAAIQLLKLGRMGSASDFAKVRNAIMKRHPQVWAMYGKNLSWEKTKRAHAKGIAHRKTSRRKTSRRAA